MRIRARWCLAGLLAGGAMMVGCGASGGGGGGGTDAGMMGDTGGMTGDTGRTDGGRTDGGTTDRPMTPVDRPPPVTNPCATDAIVDLTMRMPDSEGVVTYSGNNNRAPDMGGPTPPMGCLAGMNMPRAAYQVVHRYRMRTTGVLVASTATKGTSEALDTVLYVSTSCMGGMSLGCNDDVAQQVFQSRVATGSTVMAGTEVFIVVGTYSPPVMGAEEQGDYELQISEIQPTPIGMACTGASVCATGSVCIANPGSTTMGTCIGDGAARGRCRLEGMACDMGLTCSVAMPTAMTRGTCQRTVAVGMPCGEPGTVCAMGSTCQASNPADASVRTCVADGVQGGRCRTDSPRCDMGLECSSATAPTCRAAAMAGGECDVAAVRTFCPMGNTCAPGMMAGTFTCQGNGTAAGTACRTEGMRCDMGLECSTTMGAGVCRRTVAAMGMCDLRNNTTVCAMGTTCLGAMPGAATGTCTAPTMEMEPNNTPAMANPNVMTTTVFRGAIMPADDVDCFNVTVPAMASLRVTTLGPGRTCNLGEGGDSVINVYRMGTMTPIATNDDAMGGGLCSEVDGTTSGPLNRLAAGTYSVCVESYQGEDPIASYNLTVEVIPPPAM